MTENGLCLALCELLRNCVADLGNEIPEEKRAPPPGALAMRRRRPHGARPPADSEDDGPEGDDAEQDEPRLGVKVFNGFVPSAAETDANVPFVSVLPQSIDYTYDRVVMTVSVEILTYTSQGDEPFRALLNVVHRVAGGLLELPNHWLDGRYELVGTGTCQIDPDSYAPFMHAILTTQWEWPSPFSRTTDLDQ